MNTEQLKAEFKAWAKGKIRQIYKHFSEHQVNEHFLYSGEVQSWKEAYVSAAKSRDELIGKWLKQLSATYNLCTPFECGDGLAHTINTILAEAKALGYGE